MLLAPFDRCPLPPATCPCGYDLRGQRPAARCPECGASARDRRRWRLAHADVRWLQQVRLGIAWAAIGYYALIVCAVVLAASLDTLYRHHLLGPRPPQISSAFYGLASLFYLTTAWHLTTPDPHPPLRPAPARWPILATAFLLTATHMFWWCYIATSAAFSLWRYDRLILFTTNALAHLLLVLWLWFLYRHLRWLFQRLDLRPAVRLAAALTTLTAACATIEFCDSWTYFLTRLLGWSFRDFFNLGFGAVMVLDLLFLAAAWGILSLCIRGIEPSLTWQRLRPHLALAISRHRRLHRALAPLLLPRP